MNEYPRFSDRLSTETSNAAYLLRGSFVVARNAFGWGQIHRGEKMVA